MIEVQGLKKRFGSLEAVKRVDLQVSKGECFGLIGPNGAGKTTTLKVLATLVKPDEGQALIDGLNVAEQPRLVRKVVGYMPDIFQSYGDMTVLHYLDYYAALVGLKGAARVKHVDEVLELVDLAPKRDALVGGLSRGVKQRLCLAKTLLHEPKVLLLDEPASGLDPRARIEIRMLLKELRRMGKTIVISSHILEDLEEICDRIAVIEHGKVVVSGEVGELKRQIFKTRRYAVETTAEAQKVLELLHANPGAAREPTLDGRFVKFQPGADGEDGTRALRLLLDAGFTIRAFREEEAALAEVFLELTRGEVS
jgi:ABC-2 type transport system ATP-binding protein